MDYVKCPVCELNYIRTDEVCCTLCKPETKGKTISDYEEAYEEQRREKLEQYSAHKEAMEDFYSYRYNRAPKRA
jgi:hypothetical protein